MQKSICDLVFDEEYSDVMSPECDTGFSLLARMILKRLRTVPVTPGWNEGFEAFWNEMQNLLRAPYELDLPECLKNSYLICSIDDTERIQRWIAGVTYA